MFREGQVVYPFKRSRYSGSNQPPPKKARVTDNDEESVTEETGTSNLYVNKKFSCAPNPITVSEKYSKFVNAAYSTGSWKRVNAALACFSSFEKSQKRNVPWPISENDCEEFCEWALQAKNLRPCTVKAYVNSIILVHKIKKLDSSGLNSFRKHLILKGAENLEIYKKRNSFHKNAVTLPMLKLIGHEIAISDWSKNTKQVFWATACIAFFGSCRIGELLPSEKNFDKCTTMLWSDIQINKNHILMHIKSPKSKKLGGEYIDIFPFDYNNCCPVKALSNLKNMSMKNVNRNDPVFSYENGIPLTCGVFSKTIGSLMAKRIGAAGGRILGHSFRAGIPASLANNPDIANNEMVMGWGRWKSSAYNCYTRLKLNQKKKIFSKITLVLNKL